MSRQDPFNLQSKSSPRHHHDKSPPPQNQQLKHPLLQRNRTESQASYEGNTIDMVRIVRKNQQSRLSLINIDRRQYMKYHKPTQSQLFRYSQTQKQKYQQDHQNQSDNDSDQRLSSTFGHMGTDIRDQNNKIIEHYVRPSNVNLLNEMNQQGNNKVMGLTLFALFLILFSCQVLAGTYFLNACHIIIQHYDYVLVLSYDYYDTIFDELEKYNFLPVLILFLTIDCLYHIVIYLINQYTRSKYKLIDLQTSRFSYILRCRDFNRNSHTQVQRFLKSPKFTIGLIKISAVLYTYGIVHCYYYNEVNEIFVYSMSSNMIRIIEIFYFLVILPETWRYLFFEKMHILQNRGTSTNQLNESHEQQQGWKISHLTDFNIDNWWMKLGLCILLISFIYSLFTSIWLIIIAFAKIQISFKRIKYRIDTFYVEALSKFIFLTLCIIIFFTRQQSISFLTFSYSLQCIIFITLSFLLTRTLSNIFLRQQLFKHLYSQMHINIANIIFIFVQVYLIVEWIGQFQFLDWRLIFIGAFCIGLIISVYTQQNHRLVIKFDDQKHQKHSQMEIQMGNF